MNYPEDYCLKCPHCGTQSNVDPALLQPEAPMPYCDSCDKPLLDVPDPETVNSYQLLRETTMRASLAMPETEQDLKWFDEGVSVDKSGDFMERLFSALDLGHYQPMLKDFVSWHKVKFPEKVLIPTAFGEWLNKNFVWMHDHETNDGYWTLPIATRTNERWTTKELYPKFLQTHYA